MKKLVVVVAVVSLLAIGALAYAYGPGFWGGGHMTGPGYGGHMMGSSGGHMTGPGYGGHMMGSGGGYMTGSGYGGHMMGGGSSGYGYDQKFLNETTDLRKGLHDKRFEYFEAARDPETTPETITKLEKEIRELQEKVHEKTPHTTPGRVGGYDCR